MQFDVVTVVNTNFPVIYRPSIKGEITKNS